MATIFDVANYFLYRANENDENSITPLKLQKLCYYAQAWNLVWEDKPIFDEEFQAWPHGPANSALYSAYKKYRWTPIKKIKKFDQSVFDAKEIETLDEVWEAYGIFDGAYLEKLTHQETPWVSARDGVKDGAHCNNVISQESMLDYYSKLT